MSISHRVGDLFIGLINIILFLAFQRADGPMELRHHDVISQMPRSICDALSKFDLENWVVIYAVCPTCPESDMCNESLLQVDKDGHCIMKPIKPFIYHDFHDYLAGLLSCADLEKAMDESCYNLMQSCNDPAPEYVRDIWEAEFL